MARNYHRRHWIALCFVGLAVALGSCGGAYVDNCNQNDINRTGPNTGGCYASSSPVDAVVAAGLAAGTWAVVGCTVNGCTPPFRCNPQSKLCESIDCDENSPCPAAYDCNLATHECQ